MSIELTHVQAAILRAINSDVWDGRYIGSPVIGSEDFSWAIDDLEVQCLTPAGRKALAAYDEENITVRRDDLREVLDLLRSVFSFPADTGGGRLLAALETK